MKNAVCIAVVMVLTWGICMCGTTIMINRAEAQVLPTSRYPPPQRGAYRAIAGPPKAKAGHTWVYEVCVGTLSHKFLTDVRFYSDQVRCYGEGAGPGGAPVHLYICDGFSVRATLIANEKEEETPDI